MTGAIATSTFQGYWPSSSSISGQNRVRGSGEALAAPSGREGEPSSGSCWASSCSYGELASDRLMVTNLRLPGQYDERLLGSLGLQGPYYNWNRWYLPSVGRYLELDPIAKAGGFNGFYGPNWYGYAEGNPLRWSDRKGREVELYCEPIWKFPVMGLARHCYIRSVVPYCSAEVGNGWDLNLEIYGPNGYDEVGQSCGGPAVGRPRETNNNPNRNNAFGTCQMPVSPNYSDDASLEQCVIDAARRRGLDLPNYFPWDGPNSNTHSADVLGDCGISAWYPWNAVSCCD